MTFESIEKHFKQVSGEKRDEIVLFTLTTCGWCRKTKKLLNQLGVEYRYLDVDLLYGDEKTKAVKELDRWNPSHSFPTMVVNNERAIVGYQEEKIKEALAHGGK